MRYRLIWLLPLTLLFLGSFVTTSRSQKPKRYTSSEILLGLKRLNVVGSALYIAAHPDDENQQVITYMANEKLLRSAYMSLTRGDGGQNLVGPEIRERLGVIRTQELMAARSMDGGKQFFSRANDFGYSKNAEETMQIWDRDQVLSDVVYVYRKFRPDIILTRFPPDERAGHGHHTTSAIMAVEGFKLAADPNAFPEQLDRVDPWEPSKIFWNTHPWFWSRRGMEFDSSAFIAAELNQYNPLLGKSYSEIAAASRSMHKSQGFGSTGSRGSDEEWFGYLVGGGSDEDIFDGLDFSWNRVKGGSKISPMVEKVVKDFDSQRPWESVDRLIQIRRALSQLEDKFWKEAKIAEVDELIAAASGLYLEVVASDARATPGEVITLSIEAINRSPVPMKLKQLKYLKVGKDTIAERQLLNNQKLGFKTPISLPPGIDTSQPYWLKENGTLGMYKVSDVDLLARGVNPSALEVEFLIDVGGETIHYRRPVVYKENDPVSGETYQPFVITPPVHINFEQQVVVFPNGQPKNIAVQVVAGRGEVEGSLMLNLPSGWKSEPQSVDISMPIKGDERTCQFTVYPPVQQQVGSLKARFALNDEMVYSQGLITIKYDHIPLQVIFPEAEVKVVKLDIVKNGDNIGYIMGAGDEIPASLEQIGYKVNLLTRDEIAPELLGRYDAVILGVRAYNTVDWLKHEHSKLMEYVKKGGTLIVQYNTSHNLVTSEIAPYRLELSRDRVSNETAEVRILKPEHPILNYPNQITEADFADWVQERGLYFPGDWDPQFEPILSSNDVGEDPKDGGLLVAKYGDGYYIYSGYSWFRELPAGVPGAYRIFANMISIGKGVIH